MSFYDGKFSFGPPRELEAMVSLKVDNLTFRTTPDDLLPIFERYGRVGDIYIPRDRYSKESRGFAFVRYFDRLDAEDAMDRLDGFKVDGREIRVQVARYARPREPVYSPSRSRLHSYHDNFRRRRRSLSYSPRRYRRSSRSRTPTRNRRRSRKHATHSKSFSPSRSRSRSSSKSYANSRSSSSSIIHDSKSQLRKYRGSHKSGIKKLDVRMSDSNNSPCSTRYISQDKIELSNSHSEQKVNISSTTQNLPIKQLTNSDSDSSYNLNPLRTKHIP